jgi:isopentenyl-diphosphate delta-isomerase
VSLSLDLHAMIPAWDDGILQPQGKLEVHLRGLRHMAVSIFVIDGADVLIQQRALGKYHTPGLWANTCCTHPHWGEAPEHCATRRLTEELGLRDYGPLQHRQQVEYRADVGDSMVEHELVDIFVACSDRAQVQIAANSNEVMAVRWVNVHDLRAEIAATPAKFTPWMRIYMAEHFDLIFGAL